MGYIYKISNQINGKVYIGKTERTIEVRWKEHKRHINELQHLPLYRALKKYGVENFKVEELEQCNNLILDEREIFWIKQYNSYKGRNGYNCTGGGEGGIIEYDENELDDIAIRYQAGERLDLLCKEYHHDYNRIKPLLEKRGVVINKNAGPKKLSKMVAAINPENGEIVHIYESISAAARSLCQEGRNPRAIGNHVSKYKDTDTISHGYLWMTQEKLSNIEELFEKLKNK